MRSWLSVQDAVSCNSVNETALDGCQGGSSLYVYNRIKTGTAGTLSHQWCNAYTGKDAATGSTCGTGRCTTSLGYQVLDSAMINLDDKNAQWESYKTEVRTNGPVSCSMQVFSDFSAYFGGIFRTTTSGECAITANSTFPCGHEIMCFGWGKDDAGKEYYRCQNSWG